MRRRQKKRNQNGVGQVIGDRRSAIGEIHISIAIAKVFFFHGALEGRRGKWEVSCQHNPQVDIADLLIKSFVELATFFIHPVFWWPTGRIIFQAVVSCS